MKKEMKMLENGNYEQVISPIQHECSSKDHIMRCVEYSWAIGMLVLEIEDGDPCEEGYSNSLYVNFCPFCGYKAGDSKNKE